MRPTLSFLLKLSARMRKKRLELFRKHIPIQAKATILDVGGSGSWHWDALPEGVAITVLNICDKPPDCMFTYVKGSACDMGMFANGSFDIVFSNSVIEHLPTREDQERMAAEVRRVGKSYWIQTPNKHFPLELHLVFPFIQYFPERMRVAFAKIWPFSFQRMQGLDPVDDARAILLTRKTFRRLFPDATMLSERLLGLDKSLIAFGRADPGAQ